jgi:hypothetical protein
MAKNFHTVQFTADASTALKVQEKILGKTYENHSFRITDGGGSNTMMLEIIPPNGVYNDIDARSAFSALMGSIGKTSEAVSPIFISNQDLSTKLGFTL